MEPRHLDHLLLLFLSHRALMLSRIFFQARARACSKERRKRNGTAAPRLTLAPPVSAGGRGRGERFRRHTQNILPSLSTAVWLSVGLERSAQACPENTR